jgi:transglutaminase-like putative cysteine protease
MAARLDGINNGPATPGSFHDARGQYMRSSVIGMLALAWGLGMTSAYAQEAPPPGASRAWTSTDPVVVKARELTNAGSLQQAESLLDSVTGAPGEADRAEMRETIRRLRREFTLTEEELLKRLRQSIPDATAADAARWRAEGRSHFRTIDGQVLYYNREPGCTLRACPEARQRRDAHAATRPAEPAAGPTPKEKLLAHLRQVVEEAGRSGRVEVTPVRHRIDYKLTVLPNRPGARPGSILRCWLPFPQEYRQQKPARIVETRPAHRSVAPNGMQDGRLTGARQRTIYFEQTITDPAEPVTFAQTLEYDSYAYYPDLKEAEARPLRPDSVDPVYLAERPPHIVFSPTVREIVARVAGDEPNPLVRARRIFEFVSNEICWVPEQEYAVLGCLSGKGLQARMGDCGVQSMVFITLCRAAGIPARWQSGWESKPDDPNMHDWSEMYIEPWGWLPVDASYGLQPSEDPRIRYFYLGHQDAYRMIVNLDYGWPLQPAKPSLRSEPLDFQRGEVELDGRNLYFDEWKYDMNFDRKPVPE